MTRPARLRVGLAGAGSMGRNHLRDLLERDDVDVVGVADTDAQARTVAAASAGANPYGDASELLRAERPEALIVATPTTRHHAIALAALEQGVPVLVEKPLAATADEAHDLARAVDRTGVLLQVGHVERSNPCVEALVRHVRAGIIGAVYSVRSVRAGPFPAHIRDTGVTMDLATHESDIMCWLLDERPIRAYAEIARRRHPSHEDLLCGLLVFPGGAIGRIDVDWLSPAKVRRLTVLGSKGMMEADYLRQSLTVTHPARDTEPAYLDGYAPTFAGETVRVPVERAEPLRREHDAFFAAIRTGGVPPVDVRDGLWAVIIGERLLASAAAGRPLPVGPPDPA